MIDDEDGVPYRIGDSFYRVSPEEARSEVEGEIGRMQEEIRGIRGQLEVLKRLLYGKFGSSINLEK